MSSNILESLKEHLSGDVISNLAKLIGESDENTETALGAALPALLAGLTNQDSDSSSIGTLFNLLTSGNHDGGLLSNLGAISRGGDETDRILAQGGNLITSLFGDKNSELTDLIANASGINRAASSSLLSFIAPVALGLIGKTLKIDHIDNVSGFTDFLKNQSGLIKSFLPDGFDNLLASGLGLASGMSIPITPTPASLQEEPIAPSSPSTPIESSAESTFDKAMESIDMDNAVAYVKDKTTGLTDAFDNIGDKIEDMTENTLAAAKGVMDNLGESASSVGSHIAEESKEFAHSAAEAFEEGAEKSGKILPWLLVAAAVALVWGLLRSCSTPETTPDANVNATAPAVSPPTNTAPEPPKPAAPAVPATPEVIMPPPAPKAPEPEKAVEPNADKATESSGDYYEKTLANGYAIKSAKDGFESRLLTFIESDDAIKEDLWFTMTGILFDTNRANIKTESNTQINHIAEILKTYPNVNIKIGGYTDNTGKANANKKLSNNRANAVRKAIVAKGIKADRIAAEGYGSEHPVASNETPEGRQQNRRIDVRVTAK